MNNILSANLFQRIITGIVGISIILLAIYWSKWTYGILLLLIMVFCLEEFYRLIKTSGVKPFRLVGIGYGIIAYSLSFLMESRFLNNSFYFLLIIIPSLFFIIQLYKKPTQPFTDLAFTFLGTIYIVIPFCLFHQIAFFDDHCSYDFENVMGIFFLIWANDIGAYFIGKAFGKRKLFERISPKKTWEGTIGGALFTFGIAFIISIYFERGFLMHEWIIIAGIISVCGTYGDLVESMLKRSIQIKDSGSLLKGHGGFLDRFDSLLLALPFIVGFLVLWHIFFLKSAFCLIITSLLGFH